MPDRRWVRGRGCGDFRFPVLPLLALVTALSCLAPCADAGPASAAVARAVQDSRLDPMLRGMLDRGAPDAELVRGADGAAPDAGAGSMSDWIPLLLRGDIREADLSALGVRIGTQAGPVTTVLAPLASVPALLDVRGVEAIDAPGQLQPLLDKSAAEVAAPAMWGGSPPNYAGAAGRGVLIGIIDTGIDLSNPDFRTSANQTRVKYLWDQSVTGPGPSGFCCGKEYTESQINAGTATEVDTDGHGTHMAGIAAANGRATGGGYPMYRYVGIAPEANLVVVKLNPVVLETSIIDGVNYIFQKATSLGQDCVVLVAYGLDRGAHDGSYSLDAALSALTGRGRIVVAAAGNNGGKAMHAQANLASGQSTSITFTIPAYTPSAFVSEFLGVEGWHGSGALFNARLTSPSGFTSGWIAPGTAHNNLYTTDGTFYLDNDLTTNSKGAKQILAWIWDYGDGNVPKAGTWKLELQRLTGTSSGLFDAWISRWLFGSAGVAPVFTSQVNFTELIQSPATADSVISAGAYTTKTGWRTATGDSSYYIERPVLGDIAVFSSPGPRRDGVQRPDVAAPGQGVAASLSAAGVISGTFKVDDGVHWIYRGTSAAAAHVAGGVALLLEDNPHLTPSAVRQALTQRARADGFTHVIPNATWGYGKLHLTAPGSAGLSDGSPVSLQLSPAFPNPARGAVSFDLVLSSQDVGVSTTGVLLRIFDLSGREVAVIPGQSVVGTQRLEWNGMTLKGRPAAAGIYLGRLEVGARSVVRKFVRLM